MKPTPCRALSLAALGVLAGCKVYHALPLDTHAKEAALASPDLVRVVGMASELRHPLLQPVAIDLKRGLSAEEASVLAVVANPDLRAVRDQRSLAEAQLLDAGLLPDPVLSTSEDFPTGGNPQGAVTARTTQVDLDLTAILTRGLRKRSAKRQQESVDLDVAWQEWQVAQAAKLSVYRLSALISQADWAEEASAALGENLRALEKSAGTGGAGLNDLVSARAAADAGQRSALGLRQARDRERRTLNALLGLPPGTDLKLAGTDSARTWTDLPSEAELAQGLDRRLDLLALEKGYASEDARLRLAVWSQFPSIEISLRRSRDNTGIASVGGGVALSLPIFNRGQGAVALEQATRRQLFDQYQSRLFHARSDLGMILSDMAQVRGMLAQAEKAGPSLEAQWQAGERAYQAGNLDLLGRNQARMAWLAQRATLAALHSSLDELGVALEIASGRTLSRGGVPR